MKKKLRLCLWIVLIAVLFIGGTATVLVSIRDRELSRRTAPTLAELTQLAARPREAAEATSDGREPESTSAVENAEAAISELPTSLTESVTPEMLSSEFEETRADQFLERRFAALACQVAEAGVAFFSEEQAAGWAYETASEKMQIGQWDSARRYCWQVLDSDIHPYMRGNALTNLAWLEEDREKAALLLEMSCETEDRYSLGSAIRLCRATGSTALADHYLARLRVIEPKWAKSYDTDD